MTFKTYIQTLNKFQTFQLYTIIALLVYLPYYFFSNEFNIEDTNSNKNLIQIKQNIQKMKEKIKIPNFIEVLKEFELEAKRYKTLKINNTTIGKNSINITGKGSIQELLHFLSFSENYSYNSTLQSINIKPINKEQYLFSFKIIFKKAFSNKISSKQNLKLQEKISSLAKTKEASKLQAIVGNYAIIDEKFYTKGDKYQNTTIKQIDKNHIVLSNEKKLYITKRSKDEKTK